MTHSFRDKTEGAHRSGEGGEEPAQRPRIEVTSREAEGYILADTSHEATRTGCYIQAIATLLSDPNASARKTRAQLALLPCAARSQQGK